MGDRPMLYDTSGAVRPVFDTSGAVVFGARTGGGIPGGGWVFPGEGPQLPAVGTMAEFTTYDGSNATCHPSVVDMRAVTGSDWMGYRWWIGDTPYVSPAYVPPGARDSNWIENPCVWASNDRITWEVPTGVVNPLEGPPETGWYADTEMVWDPEAKRLVLTYLGPGGQMRAFQSVNGNTWTPVAVPTLTLPGGTAVSPTIVRTGPNVWKMWMFADTQAPNLWTGPSPVGPWTLVGRVTVTNMPASLWHGDIIEFEGMLIGVGSDRGTNVGYPMVSRDGGMTWKVGPAVASLKGYRTTLALSERAGYVESWNGALGFNRPTWHLTPISTWTSIT